MPTTQPVATFTPFGAIKVGSHHWTFFVGDYRHDRVFPTKRAAIIAMHAYMNDDTR